MNPPDRQSHSQSGAFVRQALEAGSDARAGRDRDLPHRLVLGTLAFLLLAISTWCLVLLYRSVGLRQDLDRHQDWIDQMRTARSQLEQPVSELASQSSWPALERLRQESERLLEGHQDPDLRLAAQRSKSSLEQLRQALQEQAGSDDPALTEKVWDRSFAVLGASSALEEKIQRQVDGIYDRLEGHWRAIEGLVLVCLLLCASNLALLHLAHRRREQLERARDQALELASHDALTGAWNREAILEMLRREIARSKRLEVSMGLILVDVDGFHEINGLVGQEHGDVVLRELAWRLGSLVRPYDTMGRFGGDAFLILLPTCGRDATASVTRRLAEALDGSQVDYGVGRIEVSVGMAHATLERPDETDPDLLIHRLQEALARARETMPKGAIVALEHTRAMATAVESAPPAAR